MHDLSASASYGRHSWAYLFDGLYFTGAKLFAFEMCWRIAPISKKKNQNTIAPRYIVLSLPGTLYCCPQVSCHQVYFTVAPKVSFLVPQDIFYCCLVVYSNVLLRYIVLLYLVMLLPGIL